MGDWPGRYYRGVGGRILSILRGMGWVYSWVSWWREVRATSKSFCFPLTVDPQVVGAVALPGFIKRVFRVQNRRLRIWIRIGVEEAIGMGVSIGRRRSQWLGDVLAEIQRLDEYHPSSLGVGAKDANTKIHRSPLADQVKALTGDLTVFRSFLGQGLTAAGGDKGSW